VAFSTFDDFVREFLRKLMIGLWVSAFAAISAVDGVSFVVGVSSAVSALAIAGVYFGDVPSNPGVCFHPAQCPCRC